MPWARRTGCDRSASWRAASTGWSWWSPGSSPSTGGVPDAAEGATADVDADYREPERLLALAGETLDLSRPVAVLVMGVLGYVEAAEMHRVVRTLMGAVGSGSYLALWDGTDTSPEIGAAAAAQADAGSPYRHSSAAQLRECFAGLEMVEPGLVSVTRWRPDPTDVGDPLPVDGYGGVARKP